MDATEFGNYFKEQRIKSGYKSQRKLAMESGISNGTIARIESGTQRATMETLRTLSKYLTSCSYGEMLEKSGYFEGLSNEKKAEMISAYDFRLEFTEEFRELIKKIAPNGKFTENIKKDIISSVEKYVDDDFAYTPDALVELMYEKGDASDMADLYASVFDVVKMHLPNLETGPEHSPPSILDKYIRSFVNLLIGDREHPFFNSIDHELNERIGKLFIQHGVKSTNKLIISDKSGFRDDIPEQTADILLAVDNAQFQWDVLQELQDIAHEFHLWFNPAYEVGVRQPRPTDLESFIEHGNIIYRDRQLTDQDRRRILEMLNLLFPTN